MAVTIIYLVLDNEHPLYENDFYSPAVVWKRTLTIENVNPATDCDPDWCYDRIIENNPELEAYTIAIWAVDKDYEYA